jgi:predicted GNAT family acetyltransferase
MDDEVTENSALHRFELPLGGGAMALAYYTIDDGQLVLTHTEVPMEFSGQGIATRLARGTFDLLRQSGRKAVLKCPFMGHFFATHPEYADVVAG